MPKVASGHSPPTLYTISLGRTVRYMWMWATSLFAHSGQQMDNALYTNMKLFQQMFTSHSDSSQCNAMQIYFKQERNDAGRKYDTLFNARCALCSMLHAIAYCAIEGYRRVGVSSPNEPSALPTHDPCRTHHPTNCHRKPLPQETKGVVHIHRDPPAQHTICTLMP